MATLTVVKPPSDTAWPLYNQPTGLAFFPIFKNAHSSLVEWLCHGGPGFVTHIVDVPEDVESFAVVRDPFDRYISGLAQMHRQNVAADVDWPALVDGVERYNWRTGVPYTHNGDRHFHPQSDVIERMPGKPRLFPMGRRRVSSLSPALKKAAVLLQHCWCSRARSNRVT